MPPIFPKIPFTRDYQLFNQVSKLGEELINLHLLKSPALTKTTSRFKGGNGDFIKRVNYDAKQKRIYTNEKQYFTNIEPEVLNYYIGGYQVLNNWLKDRKNRNLSSEEINHFIRVIESIRKTIGIQKEIDKLYLKVEKNLI